MQIVVLIPLTHPSCMTGQPAHCLCVWRIPVQIRLSVSSVGQESAAFLNCSCPWETATTLEKIACGIRTGFLQRGYWQFLSEQGKKPHYVRLRTSRFLYNLLNICSWSRDMAKVKVWGFFFPPVGISLYILKPKNCCLFWNAFLVAVKYSLLQVENYY